MTLVYAKLSFMLLQLLGSLRRLSSRLMNAAIDHYYGIETRRLVSVRSLGIPAEHSHGYAPVEWFSLPPILKQLEPGPGDVFLDLGCGKGRALLIASHFSFRKIIGVELAESLVKQACANRDRYLKRGRSRCRQLEIVHGNAAEYRIPPEVTMLFLFSPFRGPILSQVVQNLRRSVAEMPRRVHLIYHSPGFHEQIMAGLGSEVRVVHESVDYVIYQLGADS